MDLTQEYLKSIFYYCPGTGYLYRDGKRAGYRFSSADNTYRSIQIKGKSYREHRVIWLYVYGEWPKGCIDHIDGNRSNNRVSNLRDVSYLENQKNRKLNANNSSGMPGVTWNKPSKSWRVSIYDNR